MRASVRQDDLLDEVTKRGAELYETQLRDRLERYHLGEMVAIHGGTREFAVGVDQEEAVRRLRVSQPEGLLFVRRIGPPTPADQRLAARFARDPKE